MGTTGEGLLRPSGNCECSGATVHSPEHSLPDMPSLGLRGTECSGATVHGPEHSLPKMTSLGSSGDSGAQGPLFAAPSTLSRNLVFLVIGELGCSGTTMRPELPLPGTWSFRVIGELGYLGTTVHGPERPLPKLGLLGPRGDSLRGKVPRGIPVSCPRDLGTPSSHVTDSVCLTNKE